MRMDQIEILQIFVPNLREIYLLGTGKIAFSAKLKLIQRHGSQITGLTVKNSIFGAKIQ